jgi:hypothetical protein
MVVVLIKLGSMLSAMSRFGITVMMIYAKVKGVFKQLLGDLQRRSK